MRMTFRKATEHDLDSIMMIIGQAQAYFRENRINQWQNQYPNVDIIKADIEKGYTTVMLIEEKIVATACISFDGVPNYETIYDGKWLWDGNYAAIQRLAVDQDYKGTGLATKFIKIVEQMCLDKGVKSIRVVTHENNVSMQKVLQKNNFTHCGHILVSNGEKRIAFEKILEF